MPLKRDAMPLKRDAMPLQARRYATASGATLCHCRRDANTQKKARAWRALAGSEDATLCHCRQPHSKLLLGLGALSEFPANNNLQSLQLMHCTLYSITKIAHSSGVLHLALEVV
jgi:hypothetical protein